MGMRIGMALIAGTLGLGLASAALAQDTKTTLSDKGLSFSSGEAFSMKIGNFMQQRVTVSDNRDDFGAGAGTPRDSATFAVSRLETSFGGRIYDKNWGYDINIRWINLNAASGSGVEYANLSRKLSDSLTWYMGRSKAQFSLQENTSSKRQQFVDRSAANAAFTMGHATGTWLAGMQKMGESGNRFNYSFGIYNGTPTGGDQNSDFSNGGGNNNVEFGMMYNLRLGFIGNAGESASVAAGESDLRSNDARGDLTYMIGGAINLMKNHRTETGALARAQDVWSSTIDARIHVKGFSVNAAFFHRGVDNDVDTASGLPAGYTDMGAYAALGYNHNLDSGDQLEVALRYSMIDHDDDVNGGAAPVGGVGNANDTTETGLVLNYRIKGDNLKFSFDANYTSAKAHKVFEDVPTATYRFQVAFVF